MGIVIDTNVFIDAENSRLSLQSLEKFADYGDTFIAAITVSELLAGVHMAKKSTIKIKRSAFVENIISTMPVLEFNEAVARCYSELYVHFLKSKAKANTNVHDLQIAATAITHGYAVLTSNINDYKKVPGLNVLNPN